MTSAAKADIRSDIAAATPVVVKVGSSSLTRADGGIDDDRIGALADALAARAGQGSQVVLVSSGAIASGLAPLGLPRRPRDLATQQAAASVGQGLLVARYSAAFARHGVRSGQILLTADDLMRRAHYRNAQRTLGRLLELGVLPIVNENDTVATDEIRFGDNDRLAALVAHVVRAEALILLSDVDGLYDVDPRDGGARRITHVLSRDDLDGVTLGRAGPGSRGRAGRRVSAGTDGRVSTGPGTAPGTGIGTGGMVTKVEAAMIATEAGIPTVLASAEDAAAALAGAPVGTYFAPDHKRPAARQLWLAHATVGRGRLLLDDGAVTAVRAGRASLLPAGITGVEGVFDAGDPVDLCDSSGHVVARGLVNYDAAEIPALMGRSTKWLAAELGPEYEREIVHRDDLVVLRSPRRRRGGE
ncbi:MAG TPA: glutamate 5-kinase [Streptosporangiaceae bacterium]|nr:glutamate 5-kinase [Streptosporangiaceae bacterium]